jgi:hypothetical protein
MFVQGGWVGGGVGMMMVGAVGTAPGVAGEVERVQELRNKKAKHKGYKFFFGINSLWWWFLLDCCL